MQRPHDFSPDHQSAASAGESGGFVVIPPKPDDGKFVTRKTGKPAVAEIIGGPGFAGHAMGRRDIVRKRFSGSFPYSKLKGGIE